MANQSCSDQIVAVNNLGKSFGGRAAMASVTLSVRPGEIVGLVGATGGGKTTTLRILAGLLRHDRGDGMVLGARVGAIGVSTRQHLGYMAQSHTLYSELTVAETLRFRAAVHGIADVQTRIAEVTEDYGLQSILRQRCAALSGGWARRVQFAATVLARPRLLLLDEPTAGLDIGTRRDMWGWIEDLTAGGCAVIISTHDLAEAESCPTILLYHDGLAHPQTTPAALMAKAGAASLEAAVWRFGKSLSR